MWSLLPILFPSVIRIHLKVRRGCVRLKGALVGIDDEDDSTFTVTVDNKTFHFQAKDSEERERWIRALEDTVLRWGENPSHLIFEGSL